MAMEEDDDPTQNYDKRLFMSRERFGSEGSTRNAFSHVAEIHNLATETSRDVTKTLPGQRKSVLPPSAKHKNVKKSHHHHHGNHNRAHHNHLKTRNYNVDSNRDPHRLSSNLHAEHYDTHIDELDFPGNSYGGMSYVRSDLNEEIPTSSEGRGLLQNDAFLRDAQNVNMSDYQSTKHDNSKARKHQIDTNRFSGYVNGHEPARISPDRMDAEENNQYAQKETSQLYFFDHPIESILNKCFYDPKQPEFTTLQSTVWAIVIGVLMGIYTAKWAAVVEYAVEFVWKTVPETLLDLGILTDLDGARPLPHYMWICPSFFGGVLSYITVNLPKPIPGQNEWIESLHRRGLIESDTFFFVFLLSTAGLASGLCLGPELPLVLTGGMAGSFLARITRQSVISSRVMNLTGAAAVVGGFFGFPMAGALFVLEIPHRQGLQYFEALNPAIIASICSVIANRIVKENDLTGYFKYPFLTTTLPSHLYLVALVYGVWGGAVGVIYTKGCFFLKTFVHDLFHYHEHHDDHQIEEVTNMNKVGSKEAPIPTLDIPVAGIPSDLEMKQKKVPVFVARFQGKITKLYHKITSFSIKNEKVRAPVVGVLAGAVVGVIAMFLPANLFWGEDQLQTLIDNGATPLPNFGVGDEKTAALTAYGYCMPSEDINIGFSAGCSAILATVKIIGYGLSIGTGVVGGQFWGPLFAGAASANLFISVMKQIASQYPMLSAYPCLAVICIMGSSHVVIYKAHMAIMLILTLTISSFSPEAGSSELNAGGDYSAIFPMLVVSVFTSLMITRGVVFYKQQNCRGDLIVTKEAVCEPGKRGKPMMHDEYSLSMVSSYDMSTSTHTPEGAEVLSQESHDNEDYLSHAFKDEFGPEFGTLEQKTVRTGVTKEDIERNFSLQSQALLNKNKVAQYSSTGTSEQKLDEVNDILSRESNEISDISSGGPTGPLPDTLRMRSNSSSQRRRADSSSSDRSASKRKSSFGEIEKMQPSLLDQARMRAASASKSIDGSEKKNMLPKVPKSHRKRASFGGSSNGSNQISNESSGGISHEDIEKVFSTKLTLENIENQGDH